MTPSTPILHATLKAVAQPNRKRIVFIDSMNGNELVVFGQQQVYFEAGGLRNAAAEAGLTDGSVKVGAETLLSLETRHYSRQLLQRQHQARGYRQSSRVGRPGCCQAGPGLQDPAIDPATSAGGQLTYLWFAEIGYPELFHTDVRKAIHEGFARLYNAKLTPAQLDALLQMSWNGKSAGYAATFGAKP